MEKLDEREREEQRESTNARIFLSFCSKKCAHARTSARAHTQATHTTHTHTHYTHTHTMLSLYRAVSLSLSVCLSVELCACERGSVSTLSLI